MDLDFANIADCVWYLENRVIPCLRIFYPKFEIIHDPGTNVAHIGFDAPRVYNHMGIPRNYSAIEIRIRGNIPRSNRGNIPIIMGVLLSTVGFFNQFPIWRSLDQMINRINNIG